MAPAKLAAITIIIQPGSGELQKKTEGMFWHLYVFFSPPTKYPIITTQNNLPITPISTPSSKQRPERAQNFAKSFD